MAADLSIGIALELAEFNRQFATLGPTAEKEAKLMAAGIRRALKDAERAAKSSADKMSKDVGGGLDKIGQVAERSLGKMGGAFGEVGDVIFDILAPLGQIHPALLGIGAAGLTAAVGVGVVAAAGVKLVETILDVAAGADEAAKRLEEMGLASLIPPDALVNLNEYNVGLRELSVEADRLRIAIGADIADDVGFLSFELAGLFATIRENKTELVDLLHVLNAIQSGGVTLLTAQIGELTSSLLDDERAQYAVTAAGLASAEAAKKQTEEAVKLAAAYREQAAAEREMLVALGILIPDEEWDADAKERQREAARRAAEAAREAAAAQRELDQAIRDAIAADEFSDPAAVLAAIDDKAKRTVKAVQDVEAALHEIPKTAAEAGAQIAKISDEFAAGMEANTKEGLKQLGTLTLQTASQIGDTLMGINQRTIDDFEARIAAGEKLSDAEERALSRAKQTQKAAAIAQAAYNAAVTAAGVSAQLSPLLGPLGVGAGVAIGAGLFAASLAAINSESAIKFDPFAFMPGDDHWSHFGEAPNSSEAAQQAGAEAAAEAGFDFGGKGSGHEDPGAQARTSRGGSATIGLDPRLKRLTVTSDIRPGKRPRRR